MVVVLGKALVKLSAATDDVVKTVFTKLLEGRTEAYHLMKTNYSYTEDIIAITAANDGR